MTAPNTADSAFSHWMARHAGRPGARLGPRLGGGNSNVTQIVHSDDGELILRRPPDDAISESAARGVRREHRMLTALAGHAPVPRVIAFCDDRTVIGQPFIITERIEGVSITTSLPPAYPADAETLTRIGEELVDALAQIHTVDWAALGIAGPATPGDYLRSQVERWRKTRAAESVRDLPLVDVVARWLLDNLPVAAPARIVHGDYHLDNTLFREDAPRLAAVIDWELSTIGDPLADLGLMLAFWGERPVDAPGFAFVQAVTRTPGVVARDRLAKRWSDRTGLAIDDLRFYLAFACWRLAVIVEGAYVLYCTGRVASSYSRDLGEDVPRLLAEAAAIAGI
jgi:aminoglycoside phosphotransferase (APT) family kinase protein